MMSRCIGKKKESKLHISIVGIISIFIHLNMYIVKKIPGRKKFHTINGNYLGGIRLKMKIMMGFNILFETFLHSIFLQPMFLLPFVMVNFLCRLDWDMWCPGIWLNIVLGGV